MSGSSRRSRGGAASPKGKKRNDQDAGPDPDKRARRKTAKVKDGKHRQMPGGRERGQVHAKSLTDHMLPGYTKKLPAAAQALVDRALLDDNLVNAPAADARWIKLYEDLQRLVQAQSSTEDMTATRVDGEAETEAATEQEDDYRWADSSSSDEEQTSLSPADAAQSASLEPGPGPQRPAHRTSLLLPNHALSEAVHAYISEAFTTKRDGLTRSVASESWDPAALAAMSMVVEEMAKSQAKFNAQRTMFAKSPRNQALAAKREERKMKQEGSSSGGGGGVGGG